MNVIAEITPPPAEANVSRRHLWYRVAAYTIGLVASATVVGTMAGAVGTVAHRAMTAEFSFDRWWVACIGIIAFAYGMQEVGIVRLPKPQIQWQVPAHWSRYGKTKQALLYGVVLGADVFTLIPYTSFYILLLVEATLGIRGAMMLGCVYGLARVLPTVTVIARARHQTNTLPMAIRLINASGQLHAANGVTLAFVGEVLAGTLLVVK